MKIGMKIDMICCPCDQRKSRTNTSRSRHQWHCVQPAGRVTSPGAQRKRKNIKTKSWLKNAKNTWLGHSCLSSFSCFLVVLPGLICPGFEAVPLRHVQNRGQRQLSEGPLPVRQGIRCRCQAPERHLRNTQHGHNGVLDPSSATLGNDL